MCLAVNVQVDSESVKSRVPSLRPLASLPRMRQLAIRQALPLPGLEWANLLVGATNLGQLHELQSLDLRSATLTDGIDWLPVLTGLTQVRASRSRTVRSTCAEQQRHCRMSCARVLMLCVPCKRGRRRCLEHPCCVHVPLPCPTLQLCLSETSLLTNQGVAALAGLTALRELHASCWLVRTYAALLPLLLLLAARYRHGEFALS